MPLTKGHRAGILSLVFAAVVMGCAAEPRRDQCCENPLTATKDDVKFRKLKKAGVLIPIYNEQILEDGKISFDIDKSKINELAFLFANTAGFHSSSVTDRNTRCPYISIPDEYVSRQSLGGDKLRITMQLNDELIALVTEHKCVVTLRPDP